MSNKSCYQCAKSTQVGNKRSHSNIATKRNFKANLQVKRLDGKRVLLCTQCIRTQAKQSIK